MFSIYLFIYLNMYSGRKRKKVGWRGKSIISVNHFIYNQKVTHVRFFSLIKLTLQWLLHMKEWGKCGSEAVMMRFAFHHSSWGILRLQSDILWYGIVDFYFYSKTVVVNMYCILKAQLICRIKVVKNSTFLTLFYF